MLPGNPSCILRHFFRITKCTDSLKFNIASFEELRSLNNNCKTMLFIFKDDLNNSLIQFLFFSFQWNAIRTSSFRLFVYSQAQGKLLHSGRGIIQSILATGNGQGKGRRFVCNANTCAIIAAWAIERLNYKDWVYRLKTGRLKKFYFGRVSLSYS